MPPARRRESQGSTSAARRRDTGRLPAVEVGLVEEVKDEHGNHGRLAGGELERLAVVLGLEVLGTASLPSGDWRFVYGSWALWGISDLARRTRCRRSGEVRAGLRGAVGEGFAEQVDDLLVVADAERGSRVRLSRGNRRAGLVRMEAEAIMIGFVRPLAVRRCPCLG